MPPKKKIETELTLSYLNDRIDKLEKQIEASTKPTETLINKKFEQFIINDYTLFRMVELETEELPCEGYLEFINWNIKCINELSKERQDWLYNLCLLIKNKEITMMDEEHCTLWTASKIFFDKNKKLCIIHPR